ncbi:hypothetical protein HCN44_006581 [Aphidius gifuensis]|uniref:Enoyl-CoA delta isomerase 1, mitochondrial n=1 Tax=Aphidius gifuensis TaxID=684658 RepID=A0A835CSY7_APHGI|nr:enoyl-CoA delta isomerase 1, mitochondrial-like [Aphidius gifuensis]KAF7995474.1 hypothetical protein HCN44_006581 [Aphidius gifuensis]
MMLSRVKLTGFKNLLRQYSSSSKELVSITKNDATGTSIISMNRSPVNGLSLEMITALKKSFETVENDGSKGAILTSSLPTIFSGGIDIMELYKPDIKRATDFWTTLQDTWSTLYGLKIPIAAAINGASPAGGCLLAISCEYRVFVEGKHTIGLNETKLGIVAPKWFTDPCILTIGYRQAEVALLKGELFPPEKALEIGLVDELATSKDDAIDKCQKYINSYAKIPAGARIKTKLDLRGEQLQWLIKNREADTQDFLYYIRQPKVQAGLELYLQSLKKQK